MAEASIQRDQSRYKVRLERHKMQHSCWYIFLFENCEKLLVLRVTAEATRRLGSSEAQRPYDRRQELNSKEIHESKSVWKNKAKARKDDILET